MSVAPRERAAKKDWGSDDSETPILHVDMDAFFVLVELLRRPELSGREVIVGGRSESGIRGVVSSASYEARSRGVRAGMPLIQAKSLCHDPVVLPTNHESYSQYSRRVMEILNEETPQVEQLSIDEAFLDVSGVRRIHGRPEEIAHRIRSRISSELGLVASIGIAKNKLLAKLASAQAKPDGMLLVPAERSQDFLDILPVGALWGVGEVTRRKLTADGVRTVQDLAALPRQYLLTLVGGRPGEELYLLARGIDNRVVTPRRVEKSIGAEQTFPTDVADRDTLQAALLDQSFACGARLRSRTLLAATVSIKCRRTDMSIFTRSRTLPTPTDTSVDIYACARELFAQVVIPPEGFRLVGIRCENLVSVSSGIQETLGCDPRRRLLEGAMDRVNARFGNGSLSSATGIGS
ncbi:MAG: DNA polymerase IV [Varibaculum sp.]|nr:DNA polymerase IV [Varibaculum sp.]